MPWGFSVTGIPAYSVLGIPTYPVLGIPDYSLIVRLRTSRGGREVRTRLPLLSHHDAPCFAVQVVRGEVILQGDFEYRLEPSPLTALASGHDL